MKLIKDVITHEDAEECINDYTGAYRDLAYAQYMLSRENGKNPHDAMVDAANKVAEVASKAIERNV
jgi:hypothetical protein